MDVFVTIACGVSDVKETDIWRIVAAYCILMYTRNPRQLSAFQKLFTVAAVKGHVDDSVSFG